MNLVPIRDGYAMMSEESKFVDWLYQPGEIKLNFEVDLEKPLESEYRKEIKHIRKAVCDNFVLWRELTREFRGQELSCGRCPHMGGRVINDQCTIHGLCFQDGFVTSDFEVEFLGYEQLHNVHIVEGEFKINILCDMTVQTGWIRHNGQRVCGFRLSHSIPLDKKWVLVLG